ncbi:MAG: HPF/RaiA family ribosome-associated protein [Sumerlaeia bacterium]
MRIPLELTFRGVEKTPRLKAMIHRKVEKLAQVNPRITSCHVAIEHPNEVATVGNGYRIRIEVRIPPKTSIVIKESECHGIAHERLEAAIRKTFDAARVKMAREYQKRIRRSQHPAKGDRYSHLTPEEPDDSYRVSM